MDEYLCIFTAEKSEFFTRVAREVIELNALVVGLVVSCDSGDVGKNLDFFEGLFLIYTNKEFEELRSSVSLKFFREIAEVLKGFEVDVYCVGEIFCKFCQKLVVPGQEEPVFSRLSRVFSDVLGVLMNSLATKDLFPMLLKLGLKHKKLLGGFEKCIDDDLVNGISGYSKVHYLDDIDEFKSTFERVISIINKKNRSHVADVIEYVASKLINYLSHQKNEDISGIARVYMENKSIFSQESTKQLEEFVKIDPIFTKLIPEDKNLKIPTTPLINTESQQVISAKKQDESKPLKIGIKVLSKPYEEEDYKETPKPSVSFFEEYNYKNHHQYKANDESHGTKHENKDKTNTEKPKKKSYRKKSEIENAENKNRVLEEESKSDRGLKKSIRDAISGQEQIFIDQSLINAGTLSQDLRKLSASPEFSSLLFTESMSLIQEQDSKNKYDFWKAVLKVLKNLLDGDQIEKLKSALNTDKEKVSNTRSYRRGRYT